MVLSKPLSYECSKCIAASLDYNIRLQLTKRCPSFLTIQKITPVKVNKVLVTKEQITIENTSYQMSRFRGSKLFLTLNSGNSQKVEWLDTTVNMEKAIDYLVQVFFGRDRYANSVKQTLEPDNCVVNALCFSLAKLTYPFLNFAKNLRLCVINNELIEVSSPRICFGMFGESPLGNTAFLTQMSKSMIAHPVHYSVELASIFECIRIKSRLQALYGQPTMKIHSDGVFHNCNNLRSEKSESLEVNVYLEEGMEKGRGVYTSHIIVCPKGSAIPIEDN